MQPDEAVHPAENEGVGAHRPVAGELRRLLLEHRLITGRVGRGLVVTAESGGVSSADRITDRVAAACKRAGRIESLTTHDARHTYASLMILAGVQIVALSRFMGHTSITVTIDRYGHLYPTERQAAVGMFDALMSGGLADRLADSGAGSRSLEPI